MACLTISNGVTPSYPGIELRMSSRKARSFFSVPFALLPATQIPKRTHHSSCGRFIRFGKLQGSTAADVIFNFAPRSVNDLINKNLELEPLALGIGLHLNLGVRTQPLNHPLGDKDLIAAVDLVTELADEQTQRG